MTRIVAFADSHGQHDKLTVPDGDVLVCAGDFMRNGHSPVEAILFANWMHDQSHLVKVVVCGNHDDLFEGFNASFARSQFLDRGIHYLENDALEINGLRFWGSPQTPWFNNWAFNVERGDPIRRYWKMIPRNTDVLITHGPPYLILDKDFEDEEHVGCKDLLGAVDQIRPKVHIFGHIHGGHGEVTVRDTRFFNVAVQQPRRWHDYLAARKANRPLAPMPLIHEPTVIDV